MAKQALLNTLMMQLFIDLGNALVKWILGDYEGWMPHALAEINEAQWNEQVGSTQGRDSFSYVHLNGKYYAVGRAAEKFRVTRRLGRLKFERQYYGPFFCSIVARMFAGNPELLEQGLNVMASYAPDDYEWSDELKGALIGKWDFECGNKRWRFAVKRVKDYSEPFGSYALRAFERKGSGFVTPLLGKQVGIVDIGGGTHSLLQIGPDGEVDNLSGRSGQMGINNTIDLFEKLIYRDKAIKAKLPKGRKLSRQILRDAFRTGMLAFSQKEPIPVRHLVEPAAIPLLNEVSSLYYGFMDGGADQDEIIITGGGIVSLESQIRDLLDHGNVTLSQEDLTTIQFANVRGARIFEEVNTIYV